jgi:hypothetical protein
MNKIFHILILTSLLSCAKSKQILETLPANSGELPVVQEYKTETEADSGEIPVVQEYAMETEQEPEWLIIGGQKVDNFERPRKYEYYLKSESENIKSVSLYVDPTSLYVGPENRNYATSLEGIGQLINLQRLKVGGWNLDILDYSPINSLQDLQDIIFESGEEDKLTRIPDLSGIAAKEKITEILIKNCALTSMDNIEYLPNLRSVTVELNYGNITDIKPLNQLQHLEGLKILADEEGSVFNIEEIPSLSKLKFLWLSGRQIDAKGIEQLINLEEINFFDSNVINTQYLSGLKNVTKLSMNIRDPEPDITFLAGMESLEFLSIETDSRMWHEAGAQYQVLDLRPIGSLSKLSYLVLHGYILRNVAALDKLDNLVDYYNTDLYGSVLYDSSEKTIKKLDFNPGDH